MPAATPPNPFEATERLARRVLGGSVVFFIGAGFSLDSEGNTTDRIMARLLARLVAMATCLAAEGSDTTREQGRAVLSGLRSVFGLTVGSAAASTRQVALYMTQENIKLLSRDYYNFNEWAVGAFAALLHGVEDLNATCDALAGRVNDLENYLLSMLGRDSVPLERLDWKPLLRFTRDADRGKALFLDTAGFANAEIMAGNPRDGDIERATLSYGGRLRPRHHALARLAREGWLPYVVTTNFDLLLEGAYRLSGLAERGGTVSDGDTLPATTVRTFSRVAGADQFFSRGDNYRTTLLLKIHGCVESYRDARDSAFQPTQNEAELTNDLWASYLPALVFTYREIQTWRADAWSRDLIRTMLRTQTLALCGYSGADPIMHSTFREVYEEMAHVRAVRTDAFTGPRQSEDNVPVFFFDVAGKRDFHAFEILGAATAAAGYKRSGVATHPNHVEFATAPGGFPTLDDHYQWLVHVALRELQAQSLESRLRRLAPRLLGGPCPDAEHAKLCDDFRALREAETAWLAKSTPEEKRRAFESIVGWTWHFLPGFLRELALAELVESKHRPGDAVRSLRRWQWYFPATERPEWTAWAAVIELAVRRMIAMWRGVDAAKLGDFEWMSAEDSPHASLSFARGAAQRQPLSLSIRLGGYDRTGRAPALRGAFRATTVWELAEQHVPWRLTRSGRCPSAATIWEFALGTGRCTAEDAGHYLGATDGASS